MGHIMRGDSLQREIIEGRMDGNFALQQSGTKEEGEDHGNNY